MLKIGNIDWFAILYAEAAKIEEEAHIKVDISKAVCQEVGRLIADHLAATGLERPNVAKIAGQVAFWIRKLKPLSLSDDTPNYLLTLNEQAGLRIGLAICNTYKDDLSKGKEIFLPARIFSLGIG